MSTARRRRPSATARSRAAPSPRRRAAERKYLLERVDEAAVVQLYADGFRDLPLQGEDARLAPVPGGARRARHLLRPALRAQPRDARRARSDRHASGRRRPGDARRDPALHQAVLDQHRAVQQPDRAQVRAARARRRRSPPRRTPPRSAGARFPLQAGETLDQLLDAAASRCSSIPTSIRWSPQDAAARARTSSRPARTTCTSA